MRELSLFDGDLVRRTLARLRLPDEAWPRFFILSAVAFTVMWLIPAGLAFLSGRLLTGDPHTGFLYDVNGPVQLISAIIFFAAEPLIDEHVRLGGSIFQHSGILRENEAFARASYELHQLRTARLPDYVAVLLGFVFTAIWVIPAWQKHMESGLFHVEAGQTQFTSLGVWTAFVSGPFFQFVWARWLWKVAIWIRFIWRMAGEDLHIAAGHPDRAGGLAFLGDIQEMFGILIFAMGLVSAADAITQIVLTGQVGWNVYVTIGAFLVFGPLIFLMPLLLFSSKMYVARTEGVAAYEVLLTQFITAFERKHLRETGKSSEDRLGAIHDYAALANITSLHEQVSKMHVVPFDLGTVSHLVLSSVTPMIPILARFVPWPSVKAFLELLAGH